MLDLLILPLLAAAAGAAGDPPDGPPRTGIGRGGAVFLSPMGEPFRAEGERDDLALRWLSGADTDHDGAIGLAEMQADAARFFAALDVNHDGEIDPAEIERYENEIAPEIHGMGYVSPPDGRVSNHGGYGVNGEMRHGQHRGGPRSGNGRRRGRGAAMSLLGLPEPVTAADSNFNRGISADEFRQAAGQRFVLLDTNHDGRIAPAELVPWRAAKTPLPAADQQKDGD